jgi:chromosome segregation protein
MKLKSLRIHGFKSFADRTTLDFRDGVTAIIGSNGCGKSNTADAIRWVLGEQRASALRGSKMEEVIFQGTARRRPVNLAEVSLVFDNESGRVAVPQSEIEVTRRVFREGGSEYSLNRNTCRLKDIHNLLRDTGLGSNAYAIIEAGMIETLLSDRAEERRLLFEEAAGIGRYKDSRQAAMRRLEAAEADVARLNDLVAEVESKVRGLSRQKRRAERHQELQARRLDLEVAIARAELESLRGDLATSEGRQRELAEAERSASVERSAAETRIEERRAEVALLGQRRAAVAERLDQVRRELDAREREVLVADERRAHAELRIQQLVRERAEVEERRTALAADAERTTMERARQAALLETLRERREARAEENEEVRAALARERAASEAAAARSRDLAREIAAAEGERTAAERRRVEAEQRAAEIAERERGLAGELDALDDQTELFSSQADVLRERLAEAAEAAELAREEIRAFRAREQAARDALREADDLLSRLTAQVEARDALERGYEGFVPAVAALMAARDRFPGVRGPLADFLAEAGHDAARLAAVESYLGPLLQALVVDDLAAARELRRWFREEWRGGGSLLLLPLDSPALARGGERGGERWAEALLADLVVVRDDPLGEHAPGAARVGRGGEVVDARGVVRLPEQGAGEGILSRREELARLREERDAAEAARDRRAGERESVRAMLATAEERLLEAEEGRRVAEVELKRVEMDSAAHQHRHGRMREDREQLARSLADLRATIAAAGERMAYLEGRLAELSRGVDEAAAAEAVARGRLAELEARWEDARDEEAELRVSVARAEGDLRETERRLQAAEQGSAGAAHRLAAIDREATEQRSGLEGLSGVRDRAGGEIEQLFLARDRETAEIARLDVQLGELDSDLGELGELARVSRRRETESAEERHQLELRIADLRSRVERVTERLEVEWGRPWDALVMEARPVELADAEEWRTELRETTRQLDALGPVNMLAVEEHAEEDRRLAFLVEQRDDLVSARDDLVAAIRQINKTAREVFLDTFQQVRENFRRVFQSLFQGGECDVWLADPDAPLETPIEIQASPKGKKTQRIHLLSGGERTLTALALLFALYLVKPSPFCVLDEVDAPLDESNVGRFIQLLQDFKAETQFIVITHNARTMEAADWVYGVTMEEPGVSSIVGVELLGAFRMEETVA